MVLAFALTLASPMMLINGLVAAGERRRGAAARRGVCDHAADDGLEEAGRDQNDQATS